MNIAYIPIGCDCGPAGVLKDANLRFYSLPFDWAQSTVDLVLTCIVTNFNGFFRDLRLNQRKSRAIDRLGIQFPHDFPTHKESNYLEVNKDKYFHEDQIVDHWKDYLSDQEAKYARRTKRFMNLMDTEKQIIFINRHGDPQQITRLLSTLSLLYPATKFRVVTNTPMNHPDVFSLSRPEKSFNEKEIWQDAIKRAQNTLSPHTSEENHTNT